MTGIRVVQPVDVVAAPDLTISEYVGRVASTDVDISACVATVTSPTKESPQQPMFDEYVIVLEGEVHIYHGDALKECTIVCEGKGFVLAKGTRVQWVWPGPCKYVPICLPAFSPTNCGREEATGPVAKTEESMDRLRRLHAAASTSSIGRAPSGWQLLTAGLGVGILLGLLGARALH
mmetsp:Transcript_62565/g.104132  ORF Transcript_62565/g.104132 Transcript_62565/m.104132 type:complete len:177 (-) Transcript_62565:251-781(-)